MGRNRYDSPEAEIVGNVALFLLYKLPLKGNEEKTTVEKRAPACHLSTIPPQAL